MYSSYILINLLKWLFRCYFFTKSFIATDWKSSSSTFSSLGGIQSFLVVRETAFVLWMCCPELWPQIHLQCKLCIFHLNPTVPEPGWLEAWESHHLPGGLDSCWDGEVTRETHATDTLQCVSPEEQCSEAHVFEMYLCRNMPERSMAGIHSNKSPGLRIVAHVQQWPFSVRCKLSTVFMGYSIIKKTSCL